MVYWSFWNKVKSYCKKYKVYIGIKNVGEDMMTVSIEEPMSKLKWSEIWNYCKEDEEEFLSRLETVCKEVRKDIKKFDDIGYAPVKKIELVDE